MLLDSTGSMRSQFGTVLDIGKAIVHETAAHGPVSIFNFATDRVARSKDAIVVLRIEQSQDEAKLNRTIDGFYVEGGQTTLLDAIQNVGDRVFFDFDKSDIKPEGRTVLQRQADWLKKYPNVTVTVEGHCDERGTREYNLALGERRATAVKKMLTALGVAANRVSTISYGKERPAVVGSTEAAWAQNRRGVTVIN